MGGADIPLAVDLVDDAGHQDPFVDIAQHAQESIDAVLAQYRFLGLLAGIKGPNDTPEDVAAARAAAIDAMAEIFAFAEETSVSAKVDDLRAQAGEAPGVAYGGFLHPWVRYGTEPGRLTDAELDELVSYADTLEPSGNGFSTSRGLDARWQSYMRALERDPQNPDLIASHRLMTSAQDVLRAEQQQRIHRRENYVPWYEKLWTWLTGVYEAAMAEIRSGRWMVSLAKLSVDVFIIAAEEAVITALTAAVFALSGGLATALLPVIMAGVRVVFRVAKVAGRTHRISIHKARRPLRHDTFEADTFLRHRHDVNVETDLTPDEASALGEGGQGSTRPDADALEAAAARQGASDSRGAYTRLTDAERAELGATPGLEGRFANDPPGVYRWDDGRAAVRHPETGRWVVPEGLGTHKGSFGQMMGEGALARAGHEPLLGGGTRLGDLTNQSGIDSIWRNASPPPPYLVVESKYRSGTPFGIDDFPSPEAGGQMGTRWLERHFSDLSDAGAIDAATARGLARGRYTPVLQRIAPDGTVQNIDLNTGKDMAPPGDQVFTPQQIQTWRTRR